MPGERAEAVRGQNEASDVESSGGHSRWLLAGSHSAPHAALLLRGEYQVSAREDAVRAPRRAEDLSTDKRWRLVETQSERWKCQNIADYYHTAENIGRL